MAIRKPRPRISGPEVREYLASEHEQFILRWALELDDDAQIGRSRRWAARVRAGGEVVCHWFELPDGAFPRGSHDPSDYVVIGSDDVIRWEGP